MTRCAFLIMHPDFKADRDRASIPTGGRIPVGFVTHLAQQDELFAKAFG